MEKCLQARIQEFSSGGGGSNLPKKNIAPPKKKQTKQNKTKKPRKREKEEGGGLRLLFCLSMVEIYFCHWNSFSVNILFFLSPGKTHLKRWDDCFNFIKCVSGVTGGGGSGVVLPHNFLVKMLSNPVILDKINMEMALSRKPGKCVWREKG